MGEPLKEPHGVFDSKVKLNKSTDTMGKNIDRSKRTRHLRNRFNRNRKKQKYLLFEFKWQELEYPESERILAKLKSKAGFVPKLPQSIQYGIVAMKINQKEKLVAKGYLAYDLDDF